METTLDIVAAYEIDGYSSTEERDDTAVMLLRCSHQTDGFTRKMHAAGLVKHETEPDTWTATASPGRCRAVRMVLGKGLQVTERASSWYRSQAG